MDVKYDNQEPTQSYILPYEKTLGQEVVDYYEKISKHELHPWQVGLVYDIEAVDDDGLFVHQKFGFSVSRRNGKSEVVLAIVLYALKCGKRVLYTAQSTDTCHEIYERALPIAQNMENVSSYFRAYGKEHIYLENGGKLDFRTRTSDGRLGTGYDLLVVDEAQQYTPAQEGALKYVTTDSENPQVIMLGTPQTKESCGVVFKRFRDEVLGGDGIDSGWAEWGIVHEVDDVTDPQWWYMANPSLGLRPSFPERNIRGEIGHPQSADQKLDVEIQRLGLWLRYNQQSAISKKEWEALEVKKLPELKGKLYVGIKFGHTTPSATMAIAVKTKDGKIYTEVIDNRPTRAGVGWMIEFLRHADTACVVVDGQSGDKILKSEMKKVRLKEPQNLTTAEYVEANQLFENAIEQGTICHGEQASMTQTISNCKKRAIGTSGWGYETMNPNCDIGLLDATLLAHYAASTFVESKPRTIKY